MSKILRAALYIRVSTAEQAMHGKSLQAQKEALEYYASSHNMQIIGVYADEGQTARKELKKRKAIHALLHDVESNKIDTILFWKMDRWFRNVSDFYKVQDILDAHQVTWVAIAEPNINMETRDGRLSLNLVLAIGQNEVDTTSERIKFTVNNMIKNDRLVWGDLNMPFGYKSSIIDGKKRMVKDEAVASIVDDIYHYFMDHQGKRATILYVQSTYGINFTYSMLRTMLSSEFYIGKYRDNDHYCPAYLTLDEWNKLQQLSHKNIRSTRSGRIYLFTGLIRCPSCGNRLAACQNNSIINRKTGEKKKYTYYRCYKATVNNLCDNHKRIGQEFLEKYLLEHLQYEFNRYVVECEKIEKHIKKVKGRSEDTIKGEMERLNLLFQKGRVSFDYYNEQYSALETELSSITVLAPVQIKSKSVINELQHSDFKEQYNALDSLGKQSFWRSIISEIHINEKNEITSIDFL